MVGVIQWFPAERRQVLLLVTVLAVGLLWGCATDEEETSGTEIPVFEVPVERLPSLRELCLLQELRLSKGPEGMKLEVLSERLHTVEELVTGMLSDPDQDGVPSCMDPEPLLPSASAWEDLEAAESFTNYGNVAREFPSAEALLEHYLRENAAEGLYPAETLIAAAHTAGMDPVTCERWQAEFGGEG